MNSDIVKPMPPAKRHRAGGATRPRAASAYSQPDRKPTKSADADELAEQEAERNAEGDRMTQVAHQIGIAKINARVRESEDWQNDEGHPGAQPVLRAV